MRAEAIVHLPPPKAERYEWQLGARCRGFPVDLFYPDVPARGAARWRSSAEQEAKTTCARCPVTDECLSHAITFDEPEGIWGGLNYHERQTHRNRVHPRTT
ncbi:WhiB family transcriptional regulator [Rhodococcoides fascians]|uniref:WhiB family transcriptional regulator n=1 Tax=Rhodococcoides fascians TaxID=1828 RepID=UPI0037AE6093